MWLCSLFSIQAEAELIILVQLLFSVKHLPSILSENLASHLLGYSSTSLVIWNKPLGKKLSREAEHIAGDMLFKRLTDKF